MGYFDSFAKSPKSSKCRDLPQMKFYTHSIFTDGFSWWRCSGCCVWLGFSWTIPLRSASIKKMKALHQTQNHLCLIYSDLVFLI